MSCVHGKWLSERCGECTAATGHPDVRKMSFTSKQPSALDQQEGGSHYKDLKIQPFEYIHANGLPFAEGSVVKYVTRWRAKGGIADLKKAKHFIELLIEAEEKNV